MKKHNFYAGPSILSEYTIKNTAAAVENFAGMGLSKNCWMFLPVMRLFSWVEVQACSFVWFLTTC